MAKEEKGFTVVAQIQGQEPVTFHMLTVAWGNDEKEDRSAMGQAYTRLRPKRGEFWSILSITEAKPVSVTPDAVLQSLRANQAQTVRDVAAALGATREQVINPLRQLVRQGVVMMAGSFYHLRNLDETPAVETPLVSSKDAFDELFS